MQEDVRKYAERAAALAFVVLDAEDGLVKRGLLGLLERLENILLRLLGQPFDRLTEFVDLRSRFLFPGTAAFNLSH